MKRMGCAVILGAAVFLSVVGASRPEAATEPITIGSIATLSGSGRGWGLALLAGVQIAADDVNAEGGILVGGQRRKVNIVYYDDKYQGSDAIDVANRLINQDKVKIILGPMGSAPTLAVQETTERAGAMIFSGGVTHKALGPTKPFSFRYVLSQAEYAPPIVKWIAKTLPQARKVAIIAPNNETGQEAVADIEKAYRAHDVTILGKFMFEPGTPDFTPILTKVLSLQPDILETDGTAPVDVGLIVKQARQLNYKGLITKIGGAGTGEVIRVAGAQYSEGFLYQASADMADPKIKRLQDAFAAKYKDPFNTILLPAYDIAMALFDAIAKAGSTEPAKVTPVLADLKRDGVFGPIQFGGQGTYGIKRQPLYPFFLGRVENGQEKIVTKLEP
jgi:branched-chain amino acid transport system substrate-binding protein